jgi:hypothetical protein
VEFDDIARTLRMLYETGMTMFDVNEQKGGIKEARPAINVAVSNDGEIA